MFYLYYALLITLLEPFHVLTTMSKRLVDVLADVCQDVL